MNITYKITEIFPNFTDAFFTVDLKNLETGETHQEFWHESDDEAEHLHRLFHMGVNVYKTKAAKWN